MVPICKIENIQNMLECGVKTVVVLDQDIVLIPLKVWPLNVVAHEWNSLYID